MVGNITSLTNNGPRDWLLQRVTAVILAGYTFFMLGYIFTHPAMSFSTWQGLFACQLMRVATVIVLFSILVHAWIGLWTVTTDYLKSVLVRITMQSLIFITLMTILIWGIAILWG